MRRKVVVLPGDGVGPEVTAAALHVASAAAKRQDFEIDFIEFSFGGAAIDQIGDPFPDKTRKACADCDAILLGAVGGPKWEGGAIRPESALLELRKSQNFFANLRPVQMFSGMERLSPLKADRVQGLDILFVRELTGGLYFGDRNEGSEAAYDRCDYTKSEIERVARIAFNAARDRKGRVASVDKANVLATSRLWRKTVTALRNDEFPDIDLTHILVDAMAMKLVQDPVQFDIVLTENLFGDILSDEASVLPGSIGLAPSASLGDGARGLYEPIHGSAPDIAGTGKANPIGAILSAAMMFRHSLGDNIAALEIEQAVGAVLSRGLGTPDIGGSETCESVAEKIADACLT